MCFHIKKIIKNKDFESSSYHLLSYKPKNVVSLLKYYLKQRLNAKFLLNKKKLTKNHSTLLV